MRTDCKYLGKPTGETVECPTCCGRVSLKVLECQIHGKTTIGTPAPGVHCCEGCKEYLPTGSSVAQKARNAQFANPHVTSGSSNSNGFQVWSNSSGLPIVDSKGLPIDCPYCPCGPHVVPAGPTTPGCCSGAKFPGTMCVTFSCILTALDGSTRPFSITFPVFRNDNMPNYPSGGGIVVGGWAGGFKSTVLDRFANVWIANPISFNEPSVNGYYYQFNIGCGANIGGGSGGGGSSDAFDNWYMVYSAIPSPAGYTSTSPPPGTGFNTGDSISGELLVFFDPPGAGTINCSALPTIVPPIDSFVFDTQPWMVNKKLSVTSDLTACNAAGQLPSSPDLPGAPFYWRTQAVCAIMPYDSFPTPGKQDARSACSAPILAYKGNNTWYWKGPNTFDSGFVLPSPPVTQAPPELTLVYDPNTKTGTLTLSDADDGPIIISQSPMTAAGVTYGMTPIYVNPGYPTGLSSGHYGTVKYCWWSWAGGTGQPQITSTFLSHAGGAS